jgi:hypothetical protein
MMVQLHEAVGLLIHCPDEGCGARSAVEPSRSAAARPGGIPPPANLANPGPAMQTFSTTRHWNIVRCPRTGGKLFSSATMVELWADG